MGFRDYGKIGGEGIENKKITPVKSAPVKQKTARFHGVNFAPHYHEFHWVKKIRRLVRHTNGGSEDGLRPVEGALQASLFELRPDKSPEV